MAQFNFPEWLMAPGAPAADLPPPEYAEADAIREQQLNDQYLAGQRQILNLGANAYYRQQGEAAIHAAPPAFEALQQLKDDTLAQVGNDRQREPLSQRLEWHHGEAQRGISRHLAGQADAWRQAVADNQVKTAEEEAAVNHSDPAKVELFATGAYTTRLHSAGQSPQSEAAQTMAAEVRSSVYRRAIEAALAAGDTRSAVGLYERAKDRLTASDAGPMQGQINAVTQRDTARDYVTGLERPTPTEPSTFFDAPRQLAEADSAHQTATAQNQADWAHDASQRTINQHYIDVQFGQQKQAIAQAKAKLDGAISAWNATPHPDGRPQTDLPPPALWAQLSPDEQQNVLTALKRNALSPAVLARVNTLPEDMRAPIVPVRAMSDASDEPPRDGDQLAEATPDDYRELGQSARSGVAPPTEPPSNDLGVEREFQAWPGVKVMLSNGEGIEDAKSPTGYVMGPFNDLKSVAEAAKRAKAEHPDWDLSLGPLLLGKKGLDELEAVLRANLGQGGTFDYQRRHVEFGKDKFTQLRQFRSVANVNVGLFCQQLGLSLSETLALAGYYAIKNSANRDLTNPPYFLDVDTQKYIEVGHSIGERGQFK